MTAKAGWRDYFEALGGVLRAAGLRLRRVYGGRAAWLVWPLHALLLFGALQQKPARAFWWVTPESFPFQSERHFRERLRQNPIDAPQVVVDWVRARPFEAGKVPLMILAVMAVAAVAEVLWLSALMGEPRRPSWRRSWRASWQWLLFRALLAVVFLPLAVAPVTWAAVVALGGQTAASPGRTLAAMAFLLVTGVWAIGLCFVWGLLRQWLKQLWLPLRLLVDGSLASCWRYGKQLARAHWRGLVVFTIAEWAVLAVVGVVAAVTTFLLGLGLGNHPGWRDGVAVVVLLPVWAWVRLLGPAALGRLHPQLAATPEFASPTTKSSDSTCV